MTTKLSFSVESLMGRRQAVRHQVLILACVGSNPAGPAILSKYTQHDIDIELSRLETNQHGSTKLQEAILDIRKDGPKGEIQEVFPNPGENATENKRPINSFVNTESTQWLAISSLTN